MKWNDATVDRAESGASSGVPLGPGVRINERLVVDDIIGEGAMGIVYGATDVALRRKVAVKIVSPEYARDPEQLARFEREARAAAALTSEHVTRIFESGRISDGTPFIVMERLEGRSLERVVLDDGPQPPDRVVAWLKDALAGIAEAHDNGLVHRDLKPGNLFLAKRGSASIVKVLDFGLVRELASPSITATGQSLGSPAYMAPEQVRGEKHVDARADVWAVGVTAYELLTGELAFGGASVPAVLTKILEREPEPLRRLRPDVSPALEAWIARCLAKKPADRFPNGRALLEALVHANDARASHPMSFQPTVESRPVVSQASLAPTALAPPLRPSQPISPPTVYGSPIAATGPPTAYGGATVVDSGPFLPRPEVRPEGASRRRKKRSRVSPVLVFLVTALAVLVVGLSIALVVVLRAR